MGGDILDNVFLFFIFVAGAVVFLGSIYEKHVKDKLTSTKADAKSARKISSQVDRWSLDVPASGWPSSSAELASGGRHVYESQQATNSNLYHTQSPSSSYLQYPQTDNWQSGYGGGSGAYQPDTATEQQVMFGLESQQQRQKNDALNQQTSSMWSHGDSSGNDSLWLNDFNNQQRYSAQDEGATIPTATGFNSDCVEWVNSILLLFYSQSHKYGPIIAESIYRSLSERLSNILSSSPDHLVFEFRPASDPTSGGSSRPELTNFRTESESDKSVSAICKIYNQRFVFELSIQQARGPMAHSSMIDGQYGTGSELTDPSGAGPEVALYELTLENLEGKLKSVAMLNDKLIVVQFMEKPDTKILLRPKYRAQSAANLINEDTLVSLILQTLTQVVVDLYFGDEPDFPQYKQPTTPTSYRNKLNLLKGSASEIKRQIKQDFFGALSFSPSSSSQPSPAPAASDKERKIFIKIVRAKNINYNQNVTCVIELDNPYQQALSSTRQGSNPMWDEHFMFFVTEKTNELFIELWDSIHSPKELPPANKSLKGSQQHLAASQQKWSKAEVTSGAKFLGLAKISIDELRKNPVQKVNLMLVSRGPACAADLSNSVGGELQVELLFLEHSSSSSPGGAGGASIKKSSSLSSIAHQPGDVVSVDRKLTQSGYVITTTTITKPSRQSLSKQQALGKYDQLSVRNQPSPISTDFSELDTNLDGISSQLTDMRSGSPSQADYNSQQQRPPDDSDRPHRSRSRSRSFLRAIKKRFSFSRTRSRSMGEPGESTDRMSRRQSQSALGGANTLDTGSIDSRSRASSEVSMGGGIGRAKSMPASRDPSEVPTIVINKGRLSDTGSAFTFAHPKSQLVIECAEPKMKADGTVQPRGQLRYYAIGEDSVEKSKWRKRGTKLHLFNEHLFVACHLAGSSTCHLCGKVFSRRPGKQGYKCRNCHLLSHKQCHVKVDHNCPHAPDDGLKLEYIDADPPAQLMELAQQQRAGDQQTTTSANQTSSSGTLPRQSNKSSSSRQMTSATTESHSSDMDKR